MEKFVWLARGARNNKTSLQMFQCLNISFKGRSDLKNLTNWESSDQPRRFLGNNLSSCYLYK